jgi:hypothetical protein
MAKLTASGRDKLPSSAFALPKERKFPVTNRSHAVNALARASQSGVASIKAVVRKKVHAKFPDLAKHDEG